MQLLLVVPDLLAPRPSDAPSMHAPALARLLAAAGAPVRAGRDIAAELAAFHGIGRQGDWPLAPIRLAALGRDPGDAYWLAADPVSLVVGRDEVRLGSVVGDLAPADADALIATLNAHFAADGLAFVAPRPDAFFVRLPAPPRLVTHPPAAAAGQPLRALLPEGVDAPAWRRWQSEIQMLLHEHPVNLAREREGRAPANSLWFSGGGTLPPAPATPAPIRTYANAGIAVALAAHAGFVARALPAGLDVVLIEAGASGSVVVALDPLADLRALESAWAAPAWSALAAGRIASVSLVADCHGEAVTWRAHRPGFWSRATARLRPPDARNAPRRGSGFLLMQIVRRDVPEAARALAAAGVHPVLARVFAARGVAAPSELEADLATLPAFESMKGIGAASARLADAIARREPILVVADYDADGATGCAVAVRGLSAMGAEVDYLVPNRFEYGYGLTPEIVAQAALRAPRLIVTVDNGIASHDGVAAAAARGIDVLVTDHHLPAATLPAPALIVNPNQPGCAFPSKHLAGVGVVFYVLLALRAMLRERGHFAARTEPNLGALLDLVALGTVADVVVLDRLNRTLVAQGLARIRAGRAQPGVAALFAVAGRDARRASSYDLGFVAGPRLNAAGRLADMTVGIRCLLAETPAAALPLAAELDRLNRERRDVEASMQEAALVELEARAADAADTDACTFCLFHPEWHQGVVGIVAGRIKDRYHRPTVVFARGGNGELKGSGRSIAGFHLRDALDLVSKRAPGLLAKFGGHAYAAGLSLSEVDLPRFAALFEAVAREQLGPADLARTIATDGALAPGELTLDLATALRGEVWGQGFPAPVFDDTFAVVDQRIVGGRHAKLVLARGNERFEAILFGQREPLPAVARIAYRLDVNEWNGQAALQLVVLHWQPA